MLEDGSWINIRGEDGDEVTATQEVVYGLTENTEYTFRVRAKNVQGWSLTWSDEFTFITATVPEQPAAITTSLENLKIRVAWAHPHDNWQPILEYEVLIGNSDQSLWLANLKYCDGSKFDATTVDLFCDVPVKEVLRQASYGYSFDQLVVAKVRARNIRGWSTFSEPNLTGERIQV